MKREQRVKGEGGWGKVGEELKGQRRGEKKGVGERERGLVTFGITLCL